MPSMAALSEYVLEMFREGAEFTLYRWRQQGDSTPVLAVALAPDSAVASVML